MSQDKADSRCAASRHAATRVHPFKLELLRQGPAHNQLMSPITPYLALSGNAPPQTLYFPFEHRQLLSRLGRLRQADRTMPAMEREAVLRDLGEPLGQVLGTVPSLYAAMTRDEEPLLHVQLALSALELSMLPFEAVVAPDHFPGGNKPMLLHSPMVVTREVRRAQRAAVRWNRPPKVLFAFASPGGLAPVPAQEHLNALRRAIEPLVRRSTETDPEKNKKERLLKVGELLHVLPNASLRSLTEACRSQSFTHVHILAHGLPIQMAGGDRYGMALCRDGEPLTLATVDAAQLVGALRGGIDADDNCMPTLVSLATCDSGAVDSVLMPGGSLAHELHEAGVPWVVASQFPLWMDASVLLAESLYAGVLVGHDPRRVLLEVRRRLAAEVPDTFDWASLVAYATIPFDLDRQVADFRERQTRALLEARFSMIDEMLAQGTTGAELRARIAPQAEDIREMLRRQTAAADRVDASFSSERARRALRAEWLGMTAASEKRLGIAYQRVADAETAQKDADTGAPDPRAQEAYRRARDLYLEASREEPHNHWVSTQYLSMGVIAARGDKAALAALVSAGKLRWELTTQLARLEQLSAKGKDLAWAWGTVAELTMLGSVYAGRQFRLGQAQNTITEACQAIIASAGSDPFPVQSTRRQFQRYCEQWADDRWSALAQLAVDQLSAGG
ncbi:CHAT domain-containing protein [Ideonella sp. 4Y16]|uniref:CHAT domain-containing protein n=1 Tax=Ideonella alba TaxID=2824118 RepID=UPI001B38B49D|nr:CHAT domain-containing protein [Ideonella alba]MBQ0942856.1 CHAT domain-containing protein [Ideonella alba]